jgi:hypothetical protein
MSTTFKPLYGSNNQAISCTFTSLVNNACRGGAAIDNTSALFLDALVQVIVKAGASGTSATGYVNIYAYGTADGGTSYPEGAGTNTGLTLTVPTNLRVIGVLNVVADAATYKSEPMSVAAAFGGILPDHWGIALENKTGGTLDASTGSAFYQGINQQAV